MNRRFNGEIGNARLKIGNRKKEQIILTAEIIVLFSIHYTLPGAPYANIVTVLSDINNSFSRLTW